MTDWWDAGKSRIKGLTINYCRQRAARERLERDILGRLISHLKPSVDLGRVSLLPVYLSSLARVQQLDLESARGLQVRACARWVEEGESSSAYFCRLVKKQSVDRHISALRGSNGSLVSDKDGLCDIFRSFFLDLFSAVPCDPTARGILLNHVSSVLPSTSSASCDGPLSREECLAALSGMARGKAPGCDGLPMEFYLKLWPVLGPDLVFVLNSAFSSGRLSCSQRRGIITLSFKKGDRTDPKNWRQITLLNADYKIASRAIAARLLKVIHLVVGKDQTCGVPGRFIGENVAFLRDAVDFCSRSGTPAAFLSLDQEKAFDRVDWSFLRSTLSTMGFGASFIKWVDLFYSGVRSSVNVNEFISKSFALSRVVRQGCPLSPLLYVLVVEVLACNIRACPLIKGLSLPGFSSSLPVTSCYADDTSLLVVDDRSISEIFDVYSLYERGSGAKLNMSKCSGLWLGSWNGRTDSPVAIEWSSVKVKVLGVFLGPGVLEEDNWRPRITAVENALNSWRQRSLSFRGKSFVINTPALSRVWYVASLIHVPRWVSAEINSLVFKFFWGGKRKLVARRVVVQHSSLGGFGVVDFQLKVLALHVQWVRRFVVSPSSWVSFMVFWFTSVLSAPPHVVLRSPSTFSFSGLPPFYVSLLSAWQACKGTLSSLSPGIGSGVDFCPIRSVSTKSAYLFLLSESVVPPHCIVKFIPLFGSCTGRLLGASCSFSILIAPSSTFHGKWLMGCCTQLSALLRFAIMSPLFVSALPPSNLYSIYFSIVLWPPVLSLGSSRCCSWLLLFVPPCSPVMCSLVFLVMSCGLSPGFLFICLTFVSSSSGGLGMISVSVMCVPLLLKLLNVSSLACVFISPCFFVVFVLPVVVGISLVSGVVVVLWLLSSMIVL